MLVHSTATNAEGKRPGVVPLRREPAEIHDLDAEAAVLSACVLDPSRIGEVSAVLAAGDFYDRRLRMIWQALEAMRAEGSAIDLVTLASRLQTAGQLDKAGGTPFLAEIIEATPHVGNVAEHARIVRDFARSRWAVGRLTELVNRARAGESLDALARSARELAESCDVTIRPPLPWLDVAGIFSPLPPVPYVLGALDICPGAPTMAVGSGFGGKTIFCQSLALSIACGLPAWGVYQVAQGRVCHIDYEQGSRLTRERYQRLANGLMIGPQDIGDRLRLASMPPLYLDGMVAEAELSKALDGCTLAIFDSLRAAAPSLEENSSDVRRVLDMLGRVSERTGCTALVIHHARKPQRDAPGGAKAAIRGSGAIFDACGSVLFFDAPKGGPTTVTHEKARVSGKLAPDFRVTIADVPNGQDERWGLIVAAEACPPSAEPSARDAGVLAAVREHPGRSGRQLAAILGASSGHARSLVTDGLARLEVAGQVVRHPGPRGADTWTPSEVPNA